MYTYITHIAASATVDDDVRLHMEYLTTTYICVLLCTKN